MVEESAVSIDEIPAVTLVHLVPTVGSFRAFGGEFRGKYIIPIDPTRTEESEFSHEQEPIYDNEKGTKIFIGYQGDQKVIMKYVAPTPFVPMIPESELSSKDIEELDSLDELFGKADNSVNEIKLPDGVGLLEREARVLAELNQGEYSFPQMRAFIRDNDDGGWLVMECVEGLTVNEAINNREINLDLDLVYAVAENTVGTLSKIYKLNHGFLHRDLTPNNIMIADRRPRIIDTGVSNLVVPELNTHIGNPKYTAPEIEIGKIYGDPPTISVLTDMWTLGNTMCLLMDKLKRQYKEKYGGNFDELMKIVRDFENECDELIGKMRKLDELPSKYNIILKQMVTSEGEESNPKSIFQTMVRFSKLEKVLEKSKSYKPEDRYQSFGEFHKAITNTYYQSKL